MINIDMILQDPFDPILASEDQTRMMAEFRALFKALHNSIKVQVTPGRERSMAVTELQASAMWLNRAILVQPVVQETIDAPNGGPIEYSLQRRAEEVARAKSVVVDHQGFVVPPAASVRHHSEIPDQLQWGTDHNG